MIKQFFTVSLLVALMACGANNSSEENTDVLTEENSQDSVIVSEEAVNAEGHFGKVIDEDGVINMNEFDNLISNASDTIEVKITSKVNEVCKKKGCWMKIDLADGSQMRVTFKDYGFFVPEDIINREVILEGKAFKDTTSVEDLKHYAEDGGKSEAEIAAITSPEIKTTFVAVGVIMK